MQGQDILREEKLVAAALRRLESISRIESFDPVNPNSRATPQQQLVVDDFVEGVAKQLWVRAGNQSGKSQVLSRITALVASETLPGWTRPSEWGTEPLLLIVAGRTGKQLENTLLPKLRSYLEPGTYKEVRIGNIIQALELTNGNKIVFQSLENANVARERLQSYVAHLTWCDELPPNMDVVRELLIRTQARNGYNLFSFTPTVVAIEIQKYVDGLTLPNGKVYRFNMLDNPLYADTVRKNELLARYAHLPEDMQRMIFEGEWLSSDNQVYYFNYSTMVEMPVNYSPMWRHCLAVDPALKSALGLTLWAECPTNQVWYCVLDEYVRGIYVPTDLVDYVEKLVNQVNIVRRISDPHETWYIQTAHSKGFSYIPVYNKSSRKAELIKNFQEALGNKLRIAPHCERLITELQECRWSESDIDKIVNASSYHLLDSAQYFLDLIPKPEVTSLPAAKNWHAWLLQANQQRLETEAKSEKKKHYEPRKKWAPIRMQRKRR